METPDQQLDAEQLRSMSTADLVRHAVDEARLLARAEILHAKQELKQELQQAKRSAVFAGAAVGLATSGLSVLFVALALTLPLAEPLAALCVGAFLLIGAGATVFLAVRSLPKSALPKTQERLKRDVALAREQLL